MVIWPQRARKVRFQLKPDERGVAMTLEGVLVKQTRREYVVLTPKVLEDEGSTIPLLGSAEIPRENVLFLQYLS